MPERIWEILSRSESLLDDAWRDAGGMLERSRAMYELVIRALRDETTEQVLATVAEMDREINEAQREVRKKVLQHLAVGRGSDLMNGLQLTAIVIDIERIGDYTKNIGELSEMLKGRMDFGEHTSAVEELHGLVDRMFALTEGALRDRSAAQGKQVMDLYPRASGLCDRTMRLVMEGDDDDFRVTRVHLGLVLLLRYVKRVAAHLKNVCSALVNPFHQIGYRDGLA